MKIYIYGGQKTNYLSRQIHLIKKFIEGVEEIYFVQGPLLTRDDEFVQVDEKLCKTIFITDGNPRTRSQKMAAATEYILQYHADSYCLFLHGDVFPIVPMDEKFILGGALACGIGPLSLQFWMKHPDVLSNEVKETSKHNLFDYKKMNHINNEDWYRYFGKMPRKSIQIIQPGFLHLDNYFSDTQEEIDDKIRYLDKITRVLTDAYSKNPISLSARYIKEKAKWIRAGKPIRTEEEMSDLFDICKACPNFNNISADSGECNICGCGIKKTGENMNKLAWSTTQCPDKPARW